MTEAKPRPDLRCVIPGCEENATYRVTHPARMGFDALCSSHAKSLTPSAEAGLIAGKAGVIVERL
jgi:hypothetical protein